MSGKRKDYRKDVLPLISEADYVEIMSELIYVRSESARLIKDMILFPDGGPGLKKALSRKSAPCAGIHQSRFSVVMVAKGRK